LKALSRKAIFLITLAYAYAYGLNLMSVLKGGKMERFTARRTQAVSAKPVAQPMQVAQETFSDMANATANKSGMVGKLLVVSLIVVSVAITAFVGYAIVRSIGGGNFVNKDQYQAVFLSDGQIYFGKLTGLDQEYAVLEDIFYLQVEQQVQPDRSNEDEPETQISLAKLGNELHGPEDKMFINREQILFWENLKAEGQVVTAIDNFKKNGSQPTQQQQQTTQQQQESTQQSTQQQSTTPAAGN
jgi:hypothetical protein